MANGTARSRPRGPHELDRLVDRRVARDAVQVRELVSAEPQRGAHRGIELPHGPPPELLDRVVERPCALDRAVGELTRERPVTLVEPCRFGAERPVRVRAVLEHPL